MIAIWGANGFIGKAYAQYLDAQKTSAIYFSRNFSASNLPVESCFQADFSKPETYPQKFFEAHTIVLLVGSSNARTQADKPEADIINAALQTYQNFYIALEQNSTAPKHIIFASSGGTVYGNVDPETPITEDHPTAPISLYGKEKLALENQLIEYVAQNDWSYTILRIANPAGPSTKKFGLIPRAIYCAKHNEPMTIFGSGHQIRDYFSLDELCEAIHLCATNPAAQNQIFNIGSGIGHTVTSVLDSVETLAGNTILREYLPAHISEVSYNVLNCDKIKNVLGWHAQKTLSDIITDFTSPEL